VSNSHQREVAVFEAALQLPPEQREAYLDQTCGDDPELRERIRGLLRANQDQTDLLEPSVHAPGAAFGRDVLAAEKPGDQIGPYKLLQQIGEGGCGSVYMAEQAEPIQRRVALKIIKLGMDTKQVVARFDAERHALALMDHPNIARVLDAGATATGRPFFVMELVRGVKITDYCDQNHLSTQERLELFIQVCRAVQHAHQKGIIHRDLKPSNILVTVNDGVAVPKVIDFGIAKATQGRLTDQTVFTAFEQFIGTPAYMSPEQAAMTSVDIDTRSDIYSLGVLLYELLTGRTPFDTKDLLAAGLDQMRRTICETQPARPSTRLSTLGEGELTTTAQRRKTQPPDLVHLVRDDLDWIVMKCLEKDRARRYETANGLALDIQRHLNCEPVLARPPSRLYEFQKTVRRHKFGFAATAAIILVLFGGVLVSTWQYHQEKAERKRAVTAEHNQAQLRMAAEGSRERAEWEAYAADMASASAEMAWGGSLGGVDALLSRWKDHSPDLRGWEWYYLNGLCHRERVTMVAGAGALYSTAWNPDGTRLASAGDAGIIRVWNPETGRQILAVPGHAGEIHQIAWGPDGRRLATASDGEAVQIWDSELGTQIARFRGDTNRVYSVAWSPDGQELLSGGDDAIIRLWNVNSGTLVRTWKASSPLLYLAWNRDGSRFASCGDDAWVEIWDPHEMANGQSGDQPVSRIFTGDHPNRQPAWSPDGQRLAVIAGTGHNLRVFDANAGMLATNFKTKIGEVSCLAWSPNGKYLATGNFGDGLILIFESLTGRLVETFRGHRGRVYSLAWTPDSRELASAGEDGTLKVWEITQKRSIKTIVQRPGQIYSFDWHPDGRHLLQGSSDGSLWIWDTTDWVNPIHLQAGTSWVFRVAWNPSGTQFASGSGDGFVRIWDWPGCKLVSSVRGYKGEVRGLAWSPDGRKVATLHYSDLLNGLDIWDAKTGTLLASQPSLPGLALAWSPDGRHLAVAEKFVLVILDASTGSELLRLGKHLGFIREIAWSPDGRQLATASDDNSVKIWGLAAAREVRTLVGFDQKVYCVDWSPDGKRLVTADWAGQVNIWDPATGRLLCSLENGGAKLFCAKWNPDGKRLAASSINGEILQFDATAGYAGERKQNGLK
jgi:eukaryotic-like serine/threonine-protein kinase